MCAVVTLQVFLETVIYLIWGEADKQPIQLFSYENVLKLADRIKIPPWQNNVKDWNKVLIKPTLIFFPTTQLCH